ncbi:hypothetical protein EV44_g4009 [Erysiphe necator]|uniref:Uncharacterized protein n=1 Tax=Uncinula necator TaxID=52586 RepID=A0A0B1P3A0_UNCNE|nr:hypothetical protein EV44_g4009 [Erysiphe necator]
MFQNIAYILDDAMSAEHLPQYLHAPFRKFVEDLNAVARRHFESYFNGIQSTLPQKNITTTLTKKASFAAITAILPAVPSLGHLNLHHSKQPQLPNKPHKHKSASAPACNQHKRNTDDKRLLVRVPPGHPSLNMSPYTTMLQLNGFFEEKLVREVKITKTGFAIWPVSLSAQEAMLSRINELESFLSTKGVCKVEKPTNYLAYLLTGIPRSYAGYNGSSIEGATITVSTISEALRDLTNVAPVNVIE